MEGPPDLIGRSAGHHILHNGSYIHITKIDSTMAPGTAYRERGKKETQHTTNSLIRCNNNTSFQFLY